MPKYTMDQKAEMLKRAREADKKASRYASDERVYKVFEKGSFGVMGPDYKSGREAASHMANMAEAEAEALRQRAMPAANSRAQYEHEKAAGDPYATELSFEDWKKL